MAEQSFFSVGYDLISKESDLTYDLYVNSSAVENKQKFIKIFPEGEYLSDNDLSDLKKKYVQLYVSEEQRINYMKS